MNRMRKSDANGRRNLLKKSEEEDILMNYYYQILRRLSWFDQSFEEIELRERRSGSVTCRNTILDQELERRNLVRGAKLGGMTDKERQTATARRFDRDVKTQADSAQGKV